MPERLFTAIPFAVLFWVAAGVAVAQKTALPDTSRYVLVKTTDENEFAGKLVSQDSASFVLETENFGTITIRSQVVRSIRPMTVRKIVKGRYWFESPHSTRYYVGQNGYGLHKGEGYFENGWLFFNQVSYALTDRFSMGLGFAPLIILDGPFPVWFTPKITFPIRQNWINLGIGALYGHTFDPVYGYDESSYTAFYGQLSVGSRDANANLGYGYGFSDAGWWQAPIWSVSGMLRTGPKAALITENFFYSTSYESGAIFSFGARFMGRRIAFDGAVLFPFIDSEGYAIPWLGLHVPFGSPK